MSLECYYSLHAGDLINIFKAIFSCALFYCVGILNHAMPCRNMLWWPGSPTDRQPLFVIIIMSLLSHNIFCNVYSVTSVLMCTLFWLLKKGPLIIHHSRWPRLYGLYC